MKIWYGFGTEHSMDLVMIGRFQDVASAQTAKEVIEKLAAAIRIEEKEDRLIVGEHTDRYSEDLLDLLIELGIHNVKPDELEQFLYDVNVRRRGDSIVITTDEIDVQAFLKIMLNKGARVEVYSRHQHPDSDPVDVADVAGP
ncbi:DUF6375 family protein [Mycobacterium montefiorense]|uniref:Uncharacterized protein n=1 Tax=Mycobacterium montefiorense TaxID=154654 RepID=A0AA37UN70_9MYCO|nr:DUF6375 family protein [Mycobacterium montefiorense]GBG38680.1 hypothetical protein MmonteBS_30520 [Mycobacterium montefiorense]GKU34508.1 hypothetical protein NJB14191_18540 [Mycobacterium montefiorense]GKU39129.1 hypothetical protein NJB14192_11250 [Mycobacterium montefiorense]GKU43554.1 hypothetical protein NJB14194_01870 [Mycobacterium montefiorense]GKU49894.1 hypothetical protein NJB14195_11400 [Mycobacterium montefiorense]